jgi:hypothetical protein
VQYIAQIFLLIHFMSQSSTVLQHVGTNIRLLRDDNRIEFGQTNIDLPSFQSSNGSSTHTCLICQILLIYCSNFLANPFYEPVEYRFTARRHKYSFIKR